MIADDWQHQPQRFERTANILPGNGMLAHDRPFFGREVGALFQDLIGHRDFSQVMQVAAAAQGNDGLFFQS